MQKFSFSKYSGCGNDFILIDNREGAFPCKNASPIIRDLCHRNLGIGADGLVLLENSSLNCSFKMRIFNADGTEAGMCGNGLRCLGLFLKELGIPGSQFSIQVTEGVYPLSINSRTVSVTMMPPKTIKWGMTVPVTDNKCLIIDYLHTGVPHAVMFVDDIENIQLNELGPSLRYHSKFSPHGTNVDVAALSSNNTIEMRTYERGVEDETLACGTGATAVAIAASKKFGLTSPITVKARSGEHLEFVLKKTGDRLDGILMKGPAKQIYSGIVEIRQQVYRS